MVVNEEKKEDSIGKSGGENLFFHKPDLILYGIVFLIVAILFVFFIVVPRFSGKNAVIVYYKNQEIISINPDNGGFNITDRQGVGIETKENGEEIVFSVFFGEDKKDFNVITLNKADKTVFISDANCSNRKACVHTSPIKDGKGIIICAPHDLKIVAKLLNTIPVTTG